MIVPFSFTNSVHGCFSIKAEAHAIESGYGKSAMLTLTFCAEDGDALKTLDVYFDRKSEGLAYDVEHAVNQMEIV